MPLLFEWSNILRRYYLSCHKNHTYTVIVGWVGCEGLEVHFFTNIHACGSNPQHRDVKTKCLTFDGIGPNLVTRSNNSINFKEKKGSA